MSTRVLGDIVVKPGDTPKAVRLGDLIPDVDPADVSEVVLELKQHSFYVRFSQAPVGVYGGHLVNKNQRIVSLVDGLNWWINAGEYGFFATVYGK